MAVLLETHGFSQRDFAGANAIALRRSLVCGSDLDEHVLKSKVPLPGHI